MKSLKVKQRIKRRRFSNKKTNRNKKRGGMYKKSKPLPLHKQQEITAVHAALPNLPLGVSPGLRNLLLTTGDGGLTRELSRRLLATDDTRLMRGLHRRGDDVLHAAAPHSVHTMVEADGMFQQAEQLCLELRRLPDAEMWIRGRNANECTPQAREMCMQAVRLYEGAIERKYLPAYAPLAWMMSYADPDKSLSLCDECIAACNARTGAPFERKSKIDCIALRAFVQHQQDELLQNEIEMATPGKWSHMEVPTMNAPPVEQLREIAKKSIAEGSKYGYALEWSLLSSSYDTPTRDEAVILTALMSGEEMGLDFQRCRFCVRPAPSPPAPSASA